uniref:ARAD1A16874p n=1 Tax=Blastobotrys adeninivorans TaxID=409370 RepID=A0A060SZ32_BLAAD
MHKSLHLKSLELTYAQPAKLQGITKEKSSQEKTLIFSSLSASDEPKWSRRRNILNKTLSYFHMTVHFYPHISQFFNVSKLSAADTEGAYISYFEWWTGRTLLYVHVYLKHDRR